MWGCCPRSEVGMPLPRKMTATSIDIFAAGIGMAVVTDPVEMLQNCTTYLVDSMLVININLFLLFTKWLTERQLIYSSKRAQIGTGKLMSHFNIH